MRATHADDKFAIFYFSWTSQWASFVNYVMERRLDYLLFFLRINLNPGNVLKELSINNTLSGRSPRSLDITYKGLI